MLCLFVFEYPVLVLQKTNYNFSEQLNAYKNGSKGEDGDECVYLKWGYDRRPRLKEA